MDIESLRKQIDETDSGIIELLQKRMQVVEEIAEYKIASGRAVYDAKREWEKLESVRKSVTDAEKIPFIIDTFKKIMEESRRYQQKRINENENSRKNIYLIGMPGCGKTTIGRLLSEKTGCRFFDMDSIIEEEQCQSPASIITVCGEERFRTIESDLLERLSEERGAVISTGGGIVTQEGNYKYIKENSVVIYIKRDLLQLSNDNRPISQLRSVEQLYAERHERYEKWSDYTVENVDAETAADSIITIIGR